MSIQERSERLNAALTALPTDYQGRVRASKPHKIAATEGTFIRLANTPPVGSRRRETCASRETLRGRKS